MLKMKRILVPVDFSKEAGLALEWAVKLGREEKGATVFLLNVPLYPPVMDTPYVSADMRSLEKSAEDQLEDWKEMVPPGLDVRILLGKGAPAEDILDVCAREDIDLVIMTTRGRHGLSRLLKPNLSEEIVRGAPCPVMVLHMNAKAEELVEAGGKP